MKKLLLLFILLFPFNVHALTINDSLIGLSSTKIQVLLGAPIEKVEYGVLHKSSFLYPDHILYFKDDVLVKIKLRDESQAVKKAPEPEPEDTNKIDANPNLIKEMFATK